MLVYLCLHVQVLVVFALALLAQQGGVFFAEGNVLEDAWLFLGLELLQDLP